MMKADLLSVINIKMYLMNKFVQHMKELKAIISISPH